MNPENSRHKTYFTIKEINIIWTLFPLKGYHINAAYSALCCSVGVDILDESFFLVKKCILRFVNGDADQKVLLCGASTLQYAKPFLLFDWNAV